MTNTNIMLQEALYAFSLAKEVPDAELLEEYVRLYPKFAAELTDFAVSSVLDALVAYDEDTAATDEDALSPEVISAVSLYHNRLYDIEKRASHSHIDGQANLSDANPFAALETKQFRSLAGRINSNTQFLCKLRDRQIQPGSIPKAFSELLAKELDVTPDVTMAHLASSQRGMIAAQHYKADIKPTFPKQQTFEEAVRSSGLTE